MTVIEEETIDLSFPEEDYVIVATGPLTSEPLSGAIQNLVSQDYFHFFDAAAPIVTLESINEEIDRLRLSATASLLERRDVIVVSSVSCIYGLGEPEDFSAMMVALRWA